MTRAQRRKYHFIYKTTCLITNKYYYGMHSTNNLDDGYLGSGTILSRSVKKHGRDNHEIEILEYLLNREELRKREFQIVNEELIQDKLCMNLQLGGGGGFISNEHMIKCSLAGNEALKNKLLNDKDFHDLFCKNKSNELKNRHLNGEFINNGSFKGKTHSEKTINKMKLSQQGKQTGALNSQYGKCWITNGKDNTKIYKGDTIPDGWSLGRKI